MISPEKKGQLGSSVLGDDEWAIQNLDKDTRLVFAIGDSRLRKKLATQYLMEGFRPATLVHPTARVSEFVKIGQGCIITAGVVVTIDVEIGSFSILNLNSTIGHGCHLEDFVTVSPGVHVSGNVELGECVELGTGTVCVPGIKIGADTQVGAGAVVTRDLPGKAVCFGVPARQIRVRNLE